jgi:hypothetical protein
MISLMAFSCEKEKDCITPVNICAVDNPTQNLPWLKAEIQRREQSGSEVEKYFYIQQAEYKGQTVFIYNNCCPMCMTIVPVYNCQGEQLFYLGQVTGETEQLKNIKLLWKPANFACTL